MSDIAFAVVIALSIEACIVGAIAIYDKIKEIKLDKNAKELAEKMTKLMEQMNENNSNS